MKFLVVLLTVFFYRHWLGENPLRPLVPFERYVDIIKQRIGATNIRYLVCVGLPTLLLFWLSITIDGWLLGLIWIALALSILVYSIEIHDLDIMFDDHAQWLRNLQADELDTARQGQADFRLLTTYEIFQGLFPALFWFLLLGPAGALFYVLSRLYLDLLDDDDPELELVDQVVLWLEWPAVRLTGIVFALLGRFTDCFSLWLETFWDTREPSGSVLSSLAVAAIGDDERLIETTDTEGFVRESEYQNRELRDLLERTLFGWLGIAALVTILGF